MTEEEQAQVIQWGLKAKTLCEDDNFNNLYAYMQTQISNQIMASTLYDKDHREELFITYHGMRTFIDKLTALAVAADDILKARDEEFESAYAEEPHSFSD